MKPLIDLKNAEDSIVKRLSPPNAKLIVPSKYLQEKKGWLFVDPKSDVKFIAKLLCKMSEVKYPVTKKQQ